MICNSYNIEPSSLTIYVEVLFYLIERGKHADLCIQSC